ncbi:MAG TPA: hypothetical protein VH143_14975 [Kofleriaceae bacterium]|jgi:hypothetical protein|nr:hypothetical protein [Kofleriaceae bacterium]
MTTRDWEYVFPAYWGAMFSVLVSASDIAWESEQRMKMDASRFLEYSGDEAEALSAEDPATLKALE